jgi:glycosyltransferase involved in cell wall biosynthesis
VDILLTTDAVGGVWQYTVELAHGLARRGHRLTVATVGPAATPGRCAELPSCTLVQTGLPLDWLAGSPGELDAASRILAGIPAGIALVHAPAFLRHRWPIPVATIVHSCLATWFAAVRGGAVPPDYAWRAEATAAGLRHADAVGAPTRAFAGALQQIHGLPGIAVIHNGRAPLRLPPVARERAVLTAGRLWDDGKGVALLDRIAPRLSAPVRAAGPTEGAGARIHLPNLDLLGNLDEPALAAAYAGATVFASPARYEPFGLAVLEAAQAGLALVLADIPSFRELWDGVARFVPAGDDDAWVIALEAALADPAPAAKARAARYTPDATVDGTEALLARIAA